MITGSWGSFLYSSSVYSCHLFLISSACVRSIPFLSFIEPIFAWNVPLVSQIFLKRSLVFPILLFSSISLRKAFLSLLDILWNFAFRHLYLSLAPLPFASLLFTAVCKASPDSHFCVPLNHLQALIKYKFLGLFVSGPSNWVGLGLDPRICKLENNLQLWDSPCEIDAAGQRSTLIEPRFLNFIHIGMKLIFSWLGHGFIYLCLFWENSSNYEFLYECYISTKL